MNSRSGGGTSRAVRYAARRPRGRPRLAGLPPWPLLRGKATDRLGRPQRLNLSDREEAVGLDDDDHAILETDDAADIALPKGYTLDARGLDVPVIDRHDLGNFVDERAYRQRPRVPGFDHEDDDARSTPGLGLRHAEFPAQVDDGYHSSPKVHDPLHILHRGRDHRNFVKFYDGLHDLDVHGVAHAVQVKGQVLHCGHLFRRLRNRRPSRRSRGRWPSWRRSSRAW